MKQALALLALAACSSSPPADPPKPPPDAAAAPADAAEPPDAGEDLAQVRQVAFADVIKRSYTGVQRCWEKAAADDFHVAGTVTLAVRFGPGGKLARVDVVADGAGDGVLTACLVQLYTDAEWAAVFEPDSAIEFPLKFEQPAAQYTVRRADAVDGKLLTAANTGNPAADLELFTQPLDSEPKLQLAFVEPNLFIRLEPGHLSTVLPQPFGVRLAVAYVKPKKPPPVVLRVSNAPAYPIAGGKGSVHFGYVEPNGYMGIIELQAGVQVPEHDHPGSTEILYVLKGQGTMTIAGKPYEVEPDLAIQIPPGVKHSFTAATAVSAVQFYTPSGPEQRFKQK